MTDRPQPGPGAFDDPTRDIKFSRPPEWSAARQAPEPPAAGATERALEDQPTDQLAHGTPRPRERTLAFSHPEMSRRPVAPVTVGPSRRWPWVLLVLLPLLVIAAVGIALALLLGR